MNPSMLAASFALLEVDNQKNSDTGANRVTNGQMAIVEAELYEMQS